MSKPTNMAEVIIQFDNLNVNFDPDFIDEDIRAKGVRLRHFKAVPCPGSDTESGSIRSTHHEHTNCYNGFIYKDAGCFIGAIQNNPGSKVVRPEGLIDSSTCYIVLPRFYEDTETQLHFGTWDRIEVAKCDEPSMWTPYWEKLQYSQTNIDRARFPIQQIEYVIDANGNEYQENADFKIVNGNIHWINPSRCPGFSLMTGNGMPYSVRYLYKPAFYVNRCIHQIRILNTVNPNTGEKKQTRYPYLLECIREIDFLSRSVSTEEDFANEDRMPISGISFGPK